MSLHHCFAGNGKQSGFRGFPRAVVHLRNENDQEQFTFDPSAGATWKFLIGTDFAWWVLEAD
jgi:hypothetical protein